MATVTVRARAPAMACVGGPGRLGSVSAGDLLRCSATRGAVASKPFLGPWTVHRASRRKRESRKRKFCTRKRSPLHCGGRGMPGDKAPPLGGPMGAVLGVLLRNYGFTDLPPSLHVPRSDPVTRITESSYRRVYRDRGSARRARIKRVFSNQLVLTSVPVAEESVDRRRIRLRVDPQGLPRRDPLLPDSPHPQSTPSWALHTLFHERASCSILPRARPPAIYINNRQPNGSLSNVT